MIAGDQQRSTAIVSDNMETSFKLISKKYKFSALSGKKLSNPSLSSILSHPRETSHPISFNNLSMLSSCSSSLTYSFVKAFSLKKSDLSTPISVPCLFLYLNLLGDASLRHLCNLMLRDATKRKHSNILNSKFVLMALCRLFCWGLIFIFRL